MVLWISRIGPNGLGLGVRVALGLGPRRLILTALLGLCGVV